MVKAFAAVLALAWLSLGCAGAEPPEQPEALVLRGFHVVDVESRSVQERDVVIENGVVVAHPTLKKQHVIEGQGAYLLPALWDLKASLWGNNSTQNWDVLDQEANLTQCLGVHLYYGVAHVGVFAMERDWVERELKRADALELSAAEPLYPDEPLCGEKTFGCDFIHDPAAARTALAERERHAAPLVYIAYGYHKKDSMPGVSRSVLGELLTGTTRRHLPSIVLVDDWQQAQQAVELGASVIYGLPEGPIPDALLELMRTHGAAFAPALTRYLELNRLLGNESALTDPFLTATLDGAVRDSYRSGHTLWQDWQPDFAVGRARQTVSLDSVARAARASVRMLVVSDAGWQAGAFQGYASHAAQSWLERSGVDGWTRLSAATVWPAALFGRHIGFAIGDPADYVAVADDPLQNAENLRKIAWVMRKGQLVTREKLLPDLTRSKYKP